MALADIATALIDEGLFDKFRASAIKAAGVIIGESAAVPNHTGRLRWAKRVVCATGGPYLNMCAERMRRYGLAADSALQTAGITATDAQIDAVVADVVDTAAILNIVMDASTDSEF